MAGTIVAACDSGGSSSGGTSGVLIPLEEGNRWEAEINGEGTATAEVTSGNEINVTVNFEFVDPRDGSFRVPEQSNGFLLESLTSPFGGFPDGEASRVILLKFPVEDGDNYTYTDADEVTYEVTVSRTSESVPAGDYENCLEYAIDRADLAEDPESVITVKPGVGPAEWDDKGTLYELTSTNVDR